MRVESMEESYSPEYVPSEDTMWDQNFSHRNERRRSYGGERRQFGHRRRRNTYFHTGYNRRDRDNLIEELRRSDVPLDEYELRDMFPRINIYRLLRSCHDVRFSRNIQGVRVWEIDTPERIEKDILNAITDGARSIEDIQRRVTRRFSTVRETLHRLVESGDIEDHVQNDETFWTLNIQKHDHCSK